MAEQRGEVRGSDASVAVEIGRVRGDSIGHVPRDNYWVRDLRPGLALEFEDIVARSKVAQVEVLDIVDETVRFHISAGVHTRACAARN